MICLPAGRATAQQKNPAPPIPAPDQPVPLDPLVHTGTLPNGMHYYVRANEKPEHRAELRLAVNAGSVLENDDQRGLAHMIEHMAFNGTRHFAKNDLIAYLESVGMRFGADLNAFTSFDETVYMLTVPTDSAGVLSTGIEILADWASGQTFDTTEINKERGVVIEEWRLGQGANSRLRDKQFPVIFKGSRYATRLPIGNPETLRSFKPEQLERFYHDWYRPELMSVIAVGDFDPSEVEGLIKEKFASFKAPANARPRTVFPVPPNDSTLVTIATDPEATSSSVGVLFKQSLSQHQTVAAYRDALTTRLFLTMLNQRFSEIAQHPNPPFIGAGASQGQWVRSAELFSLNAGVKSGEVMPGLISILTEAERVRRFGFTAGELDRAKADLLRSVERQYQEREKTNSSVFASGLISVALTNDVMPSAALELEMAKKFLPLISLDSTNALASRWITPDNRVIAVTAPAKDSASLPSKAELLAAFDSVRALKIDPYADAVADAPLLDSIGAPGRVVKTERVPEIGTEIWTLSNGVRVIAKPTKYKADQILFTAFSPGGMSLADDSIFERVSQAAVAVATGGVGDFSQVDLRKKLAGTAVSVGPSIGRYEEGLNGSASPRDMETMFQLIYLYMTSPREDSSAFLALRQRFRAAIANRSASPAAAFSDTAMVTLAQHHPRVQPISAAVLDSIDLHRAIEFYRDRFADADDFTFVFVGSFSTDTLQMFAERYLGALPSLPRTDHARDRGIRPPSGVVTKTVRKGVEPKSQTLLVFSGEAHNSPADRLNLYALDEVFEMALRDQLREALGGTYSVSVSGGISRVPREAYQISVSFGSAPDRADELVKAVFAQIDSLRAGHISADRIAKMKEIAIRERETGMTQNGFWMSQISQSYEAGEDLKGILDFQESLKAITSEMIHQAALRYLTPENYVRVTLLPEAGTGTS
jgi:zinc protease